MKRLYLGSLEKIDLSLHKSEKLDTIEIRYGSVNLEDKERVYQVISEMLNDNSRIKAYNKDGEGIGVEGTFMNITLNLLPEEKAKFINYFNDISST